jgi:TetR/AcrR family transcriptional regulator, transcriptional repressor for nem operon
VKVSKEKMAEHREKILVSAAKRFRERGFEGIGVADLMKEAGLTHGGFYGHFDSKEELVTHASARALNETAEQWEKVIASAHDDPLEALAEYYLSTRHRERPGSGCLLAALGSDLSRQPYSVKAVVTSGLQRCLGLLEGTVLGRTAARRQKAIAALASMVGGMVLARSVADPALSREILKSVAESLSHGDAKATHGRTTKEREA